MLVELLSLTYYLTVCTYNHYKLESLLISLHHLMCKGGSSQMGPVSVNSFTLRIMPDLVQLMNTKTRKQNQCETVRLLILTKHDKELSSEVLLEVFSYLLRLNWKSVWLLLKAWSITDIKQVFDEIQLSLSDQAMLSLRALSNHKHLCEISSCLQVNVKLLQSNLSVHKFLFVCFNRLSYACCAEADHYLLRLFSLDLMQLWNMSAGCFHSVQST
jgi:hypothetical protein